MPPDEDVQPSEETVEGGPMYYPPEDPGYLQTTGTALGTAGVLVTAASASSGGAGSAMLGTGLPEAVAAGLSWSLAFLSSGSRLLWFGIFLSAVGVGLNWLSIYVRHRRPKWSFLIRREARA
jgi:hypothetical protein